ncbi:hypothetical protein N2152v2_001195 [Parachlorella kessleri]
MRQDGMGQEGDLRAAVELITIAMRSVDGVLTAIRAVAADWQAAQPCNNFLTQATAGAAGTIASNRAEQPAALEAAAGAAPTLGKAAKRLAKAERKASKSNRKKLKLEQPEALRQGAQLERAPKTKKRKRNAAEGIVNAEKLHDGPPAQDAPQEDGLLHRGPNMTFRADGSAAADDGGEAELLAGKAAEKKTPPQHVQGTSTESLGPNAQQLCRRRGQNRLLSGAGLGAAGAPPHPQEGHAAEEGTMAAAAAGVTATVDYPHPDIPALLERLADPNYEAPRLWGAAETAHLAKLMDDPHYCREHLGTEELNYSQIDAHLHRKRRSAYNKRRLITRAPGRDVTRRSRKLPIPYHVMVTTALEQLPGRRGATNEILDRIGADPLYSPMLDWRSTQVGSTVWMHSVCQVLRKKPQFVHTGEWLPGKGKPPQRVWRLDMKATEPAPQLCSKKAHPPPFLGVHGNPNG